jgi:glyoxylase-like metal-dependent hydrolase (beta-lactamase superfamily II)
VLEIPPVHEGQVAVFLSSHKALVTADVLVGVDGGLQVRPSPALADATRLGTCLRLVAELPIDVVLPAHGEPVLEGGSLAVAAAVAHWAPSAA